jgi:uncharacterized membrane protein
MSDELLREIIDVVVRLVEATGAAIIAVGAALALVRLIIEGLTRRNARRFTAIRLLLGRFLALGLEFLLAADVLRTAVAPTFEEIGKLAAIAAIRTALNYFLSREIAEERRQLAEEERSGSDPTEIADGTAR